MVRTAIANSQQFFRGYDTYRFTRGLSDKIHIQKHAIREVLLIRMRQEELGYLGVLVCNKSFQAETGFQAADKIQQSLFF
jgi:hypothetical protein